MKTEAARGRIRGLPGLGRFNGWETNFLGSGAVASTLNKAASLSIPPSRNQATSFDSDFPAELSDSESSYENMNPD